MLDKNCYLHLLCYGVHLHTEAGVPEQTHGCDSLPVSWRCTQLVLFSASVSSVLGRGAKCSLHPSPSIQDRVLCLGLGHLWTVSQCGSIGRETCPFESLPLWVLTPTLESSSGTALMCPDSTHPGCFFLVRVTHHFPLSIAPAYSRISERKAGFLG